MSEIARARIGWRDWAIAIVLATLWVALVRPGPLSLPYFWDESDVYVPGARWVRRRSYPRQVPSRHSAARPSR